MQSNSNEKIVDEIPIENEVDTISRQPPHPFFEKQVPMKKIVFLCSGNGGNLKFMQSCIDLNLLPNMEICGVVSDRKCAAIDYADSRGIKAWIAEFTASGQATLSEQLLQLNPDFIVTTIHKILLPCMVRAFAGKMVNLHYSLLPAFAGVIGTKPIELAVAYGAKWTGVTAHHVDESLDLGKPISQAIMPLFENDSSASTMNIVFRAGCISLYSCFAEQRRFSTESDLAGTSSMRIQDRQVSFNPPIFFHDTFVDERFWDALKN